MRRLALPISLAVLAGLTGQAGANAPSASYDVPGSIPADCSRDVDAELTAFLADVPDGARVRFATRGCYAQRDTIRLVDRRGLVLDGRGSTFRKTSPSVPGQSLWESRPSWRFVGGSDLTLQDAVIRGSLGERRTLPNQFDAGVSIWGTQGITLRNLRVSHVDGDFVTADPDIRDGRGFDRATPARRVVVDRLTGTRGARQGVAFTSVVGGVVTRSRISDVDNAVDLEPDAAGVPVRDVRIEGNVIGAVRYTAIAAIPGWGEGAGRVTIRRNRMTQPPATCWPGIVVGDGEAPARRGRPQYVITDNTILSQGDGIRLDGLASGTVARNRIVKAVPGDACTAPGPAARAIRTSRSRLRVRANVLRGF